MANQPNIPSLSLKDELFKVFKTSNFEDAREILDKVPASLISREHDNKALVDNILREYVLHLTSTWNVEHLQKYVHYSIEICRLDIASPNTPVNILSDLLDISTLQLCENMFTFVELNVNVWKEDMFFAPCKNILLRLCNDLLRRLSRSQNTVFCGRILLFLAQFFPFSERSGLNIISEFNIENITDYTNDSDQRDSLFKEDEDKDTTAMKITVDFSLYSRFWSLQNFFRQPNDLYNLQKWTTFTSYTKVVLQTLQRYKLDNNSTRASIANLTSENEKDNHYFAKFLTSPKLLELQLSDSNFRRYILVQFLILFQYLTANVKSKHESHTLKSDQVEWVKMYKELVSDLITETPPDGEEFLKTIEKILQREERWNDWKNRSCPEVKKPNTFNGELKKPEGKYKYVGDALRDFHYRKRYYMGHERLTKLWNFRPDNLEACRRAERQFMPTLENYFEEAIMQSDPTAMIEPQYKKVNDIDYAWRGLRLLSQKSPYFFAQVNTPIHKMSEFLENMLNRSFILKEKPIMMNNAAGEVKGKTETLEADSQESQGVIINTDGAEEGEVVNDEANSKDEPMDLHTEKRTLVTKLHIDRVAETITPEWQKLGLKLGYKEDEINFFANDRQTEGNQKPTDLDNAKYILQIWSEDDDDPSVENLSSILESLGMHEAARILKST